ncbi:MAG TPA: hypothetical protein PLY34_04600 [Ferruginibacter sp.]|nr:hypothetical protein [Ferruginibacter sp.]HPH90430.1 hypothetical protein [Ferruginibacter sp.]
MKNTLIALLIPCWLLVSCSSTTPRQYFERASLNCNLLYGFAGYELKRDLSLPSEKLVDANTMKMAPVSRAEVVKEKLARAEENYQKVKDLGSNEDADEMLKAAVMLYEFVIPVYKNEYTQLAALYDANAPAEKIAATEKSITDKYADTFERLYNNVMKTGTAYAEKNGIEVRQVNPSPR